MFNIFVQKEINRKNHVEALELYRGLTLAALVEALRMKHNPLHYDFRTRYMCYGLPSEMVSRLERLYFVKDENDLQKKHREATECFKAAISEID